ncbi:MAG: hypothetical protein JST22_18785 [Bacteroidetes bacterium]|nr:hypothetical protein [Bacteroidota bacterium]
MKKREFPEPRLIRASSITASLPPTHQPTHLRAGNKVTGTLTKKPREAAEPGPRKPKPPAWAASEDAILRKHYPQEGSAACATLLGRSQSAVNHRAKVLGIRSERQREWTRREEAMLKLQYPKLSAEELAHKLKRSTAAVKSKLRLQGLLEPVVEHWTHDDLAYLHAHYDKMSYAEIAEELGRTENAIMMKVQQQGLARSLVRPTEEQKNYIVQRMGTVHYTELARELGLPISAVQRVARNNGHRARPTSRPWTEEDDAELRRLFPTMTNEQLAEQLNRTALAVTMHCQAIGLLRRPRRGGPRKKEE